MNNEAQFNSLVEKSTVFINGEYFPAQEAKISVFDRGFLYGDSIYEVCYSEDGQLQFYKEHLNRLHRSAELLHMTMWLSDDQITEQVKQTLKKSELKDAYLRIVLTRGESVISLDPGTSFRNNLITIVKPKVVIPVEFYTDGVELYLTEILRNDPRTVDPNAKSGNYLNNVLAINDAKKQGAYDAIMVNAAGFVTEGTTFNVWMIKDGIITTPPVESGLLAGITRKKILEIGDSQKIPMVVKDFTPEDLYEADEAFITSSTRKIIPVRKIAHKVYSKPWKHTSKLMEIFNTYLMENKDRIHYL